MIEVIAIVHGWATVVYVEREAARLSYLRVNYIGTKESSVEGSIDTQLVPTKEPSDDRAVYELVATGEIAKGRKVFSDGSRATLIDELVYPKEKQLTKDQS